MGLARITTTEYYIANSRLVAERIRKIYKREAFVIPTAYRK